MTRNRRNDFYMSCQNPLTNERLEVHVNCQNKREGKQRAAQLLLKKLEPQATTWGDILRMYGTAEAAKRRDSRRHMDDVVKLQLAAGKSEAAEQAAKLEPNMAVLEKLRQEMTKLYEKRVSAGQNFEPVKPGQLFPSVIKIIDV